jgi:LuxR family maltose regulon positive regulatory protein
VRHALAAEDFDRAARLIEVGMSELSRTRQDALLASWARALPDSVVRRNPVLSILSGWSYLEAGDLDALESRLDDAEAALAEGAEDPDLAATWADTDDLRTAPATISVYRASLAQARGDTEGTVLHARRVMELAGPEDHFLRGAGGGFLGLAAFAAGDVREALATFSEAIRSLRAAGREVDALDGTIVLADIWIAAGRPSRARRLFEEGLQTAIGNGEPYPRATADLHVGLAELDRELDDLPSAEAHLETARVLAERASITENRHRRPVVMAQVYAARGDVETAMRMYDEAETLYRAGFYPDVRPIVAMRARVQIAAGELTSATAWADERGLGVDEEPDFLHEFEHLTLARLMLAQHRAGGSAAQVPEVLTLLERLHTAATDAGRDGSILEIRMVQALAHHAAGDLSAAVAVLCRALGEAPDPEGYARLFLDEGAPMLALLQHAASDPAGEKVQEQVRRLLDRAQAPVDDPALQQSLVDPLSQRELEVLRLLDSELTGPQIAQELYVTLNTLRTHTKRIFTKLDVKTRAAAVHRGREHGLL